MNTYKIMKDRHQKEVNDFPMMFAFSKEQFKEGMKQFGFTENDTDKISSIGGGGFILKTDSEKLRTMGKNHREEMQKAMTNETFIFDMFYYELGNHEYTYTRDTTDTIYALGLSIEEINNNPKLQKGLQDAKKAQWDNDTN